jgi:hypothetical protein
VPCLFKLQTYKNHTHSHTHKHTHTHTSLSETHPESQCSHLIAQERLILTSERSEGCWETVSEEQYTKFHGLLIHCHGGIQICLQILRLGRWATVSSESNATQRHYLRLFLEKSLNRHIVGHGKGGSSLPAAASRDDLSVAITEQTQFQLRSWNWNAINCKRRFGRNTCRQLAWGSSTLSDTVRKNSSRNALYNHIVICILIL